MGKDSGRKRKEWEEVKESKGVRGSVKEKETNDTM